GSAIDGPGTILGQAGPTHLRPAGTRDSHWRETVFKNELMTGFVGSAGNPLSRMTVGSLKDLGYVVDMSAAEPYALPNLVALAEAGELTTHKAPSDSGVMMTSIPVVLPAESLSTRDT